MEKIAIRKLEAIETTAEGGVLEFVITTMLTSMKMVFSADLWFDVLPGWVGLSYEWLLGPW